MDANPPPCRYWVSGRGCFHGDRCRQYHNPDLRENNICHKFQRGRCDKGDLCSRIHPQASSAEQPAPNATPNAPEQSKDVMIRSLKRALRDQLNNDMADAQMDEMARKKKMRCFYEAKLHPDKWMAWPEMEEVMTEVFKELNSKRTEYERGIQ